MGHRRCGFCPVVYKSGNGWGAPGLFGNGSLGGRNVCGPGPNWRPGRERGDETYLVLAKRWARGTAILFAVGAVSGTVLSFELGLLWPKFMQFAGAIIGMPFSLEGFAFFAEAIFLALSDM